ncbi:hypothetical protein E2C01_070114 [Portunus trituberculatus]|uniref:Uncharacterized protein n=1 Tax=Portunus trituberculatus TaxID=210409 RepID=A0A5B7HTC7_PORTR|nr:hypothetical protein [Portunus trituberculatus]
MPCKTKQQTDRQTDEQTSWNKTCPSLKIKRPLSSQQASEMRNHGHDPPGDETHSHYQPHKLPFIIFYLIRFSSAQVILLSQN